MAATLAGATAGCAVVSLEATCPDGTRTVITSQRLWVDSSVAVPICQPGTAQGSSQAPQPGEGLTVLLRLLGQLQATQPAR